MVALPPWTYSNMADFDNCPQKYFRKHVKKDLPKEPASEAMTWGIAVHEALEKRIKTKAPLPDTMAPYEVFAKSVERSTHYNVEVKKAVDCFGDPCDFWDPQVRGRGKLDVLSFGPTTGLILDWKTGKRREDPMELETFARLSAPSMPYIKTWRGAYVWLKDQAVGQVHVLDVERAKDTIDARWDRMNACATAENWYATPNGLCGWCPVKDCEHNRSGK